MRKRQRSQRRRQEQRRRWRRRRRRQQQQAAGSDAAAEAGATAASPPAGAAAAAQPLAAAAAPPPAAAAPPAAPASAGSSKARTAVGPDAPRAVGEGGVARAIWRVVDCAGGAVRCGGVQLDAPGARRRRGGELSALGAAVLQLPGLGSCCHQQQRQHRQRRHDAAYTRMSTRSCLKTAAKTSTVAASRTVTTSALRARLRAARCYFTFATTGSARCALS